MKTSLRLEGWTDFRKIKVKVRNTVTLAIIQEEGDSSLVHDAVNRDRINTFERDIGTRAKKCFVRRVPSWSPQGWQSG